MKIKINNYQKLFIALIVLLIIITAIFITVKTLILTKDTVNENLSNNTYLNTESDEAPKISNENEPDTLDFDERNENNESHTSDSDKPNEDKNLKSDSINKDNSTVNNTTNPPPTNTNVSINNKDFFSNDLFLGDSITEGLSAYEFLNETNVVGIRGLNTISAVNQVNKLAKVNYKNIYILLGLNDVNSGVNSQEYIKNYANLIHVIKEKFPNSKIYIQSTLQVTVKAEQSNSNISNSRINDFNSALQNMCKNENVNFIDLMQVIRNANKNLYEPDGEHLKSEFYSLWLDYLKNNIK